MGLDPGCSKAVGLLQQAHEAGRRRLSVIDSMVGRGICSEPCGHTWDEPCGHTGPEEACSWSTARDMGDSNQPGTVACLGVHEQTTRIGRQRKTKG